MEVTEMEREMSDNQQDVVVVGGGLARLLPRDPARWDGVPLAEWLATEVHDPALRQVIETLCRVSSYSNDPARASAGAVLLQLQRALSGGVEYLDDGWQTLVAGLETA